MSQSSCNSGKRGRQVQEQECHFYNPWPKTVGKLFLDKGNTVRNIPDESIYFINQQAFRSGDTLGI